ncbi:hypothetical protein [Pedobacter borealis]|uniref:hypothetical protein n=1 Tax=Pedobacter borealis TaxID=475254 RepID=UPI0012F88320|nr:hypothetical protein [Pedobacter borealis]
MAKYTFGNIKMQLKNKLYLFLAIYLMQNGEKARSKPQIFNKNVQIIGAYKNQGIP